MQKSRTDRPTLPFERFADFSKNSKALRKKIRPREEGEVAGVANQYAMCVQLLD